MYGSPWLEITIALVLLGFLAVGLAGLVWFIRVSLQAEPEELPEKPEPQTYRFKEFERLP